MEVGIPQSIYTPVGELVFNDFTGAPSGLAGLGAPIFPNADEGSGLLVQRITGADGAPIRNPVDNRPHKSGGLMHQFNRGALVFTLEGLVVAETIGARARLEDLIRGMCHSVMAADGRYFFRPSGSDTPTARTRFRTVRLYDPNDISNDNLGISGPRTFSITLVAADPDAYTYTQDTTEIADGATETVPNDGNKETWPVIKVHGPVVPATTVIVENATTGFQLWLTGMTLGALDYAEIVMLNETVYLNGNSSNLLRYLDLELSDFWSVPKGGSAVTVTGAAATVLSNDAWV